LFSVVNKVQIKGDEYLEVLTLRQHKALIAIAHLPVENTTLVNIVKSLVQLRITSLVKKGYAQRS
jgi:hypothetical protein